MRRGSAGEATERRVHSFITFKDPSGNRIELVWRPAYLGTRYRGTRDAGITGFSYIGLCSIDVVRDEKFWTSVCNARVSDRIGEALLLRISEMHHAIGLFPSDRVAIQHINHQVESGDDIMRSYHFLKAKGVRMVFGPERHLTSSARFLYFEGPDGMVFEYSSGADPLPTSCSIAHVSFPPSRRVFVIGAQSHGSNNSKVGKWIFWRLSRRSVSASVLFHLLQGGCRSKGDRPD